MANRAVVTMAKTDGFTHVRTAAGWVPLKEWRPYGKAPEELSAVRLIRRCDSSVIEEQPLDRNGRPRQLKRGEVVGRWELIGMTESCEEVAS